MCVREIHCIVDRDREGGEGGRREEKKGRKSQRGCLINECLLKKKLYIACNFKKMRNKTSLPQHLARSVHLVEQYRDLTD